MTERNPTPKNEPILIVGAGVFGLSTALELRKRGYHDVTVIDRYPPPVVDGSSVDISRVIRVDYADTLYNKLVGEAHEGWTTTYKDHYYPSGFVMLAQKPGHPYLEQSKAIIRSAGHVLEEYEDAAGVREAYPSIQAHLDGLKAYENPRGGWADSEKSIRQLSAECSLAGVSHHRLRGHSSITEIRPQWTSGAWTNRLVAIEHATSASGQPVGFICLTDDEARKLNKVPVIINLSSGVFAFPPTPGTNILKVARHGYGYATRVPVDAEGEGGTRIVSSPKRDENNVDASYLPHDAEAALHEGLRQLVPDFADHEWMSRRFRWYSDTQQGDFVIDHHPQIEGLFLATGGAGHGFKFLPIIGRYIVDCFENRAPKELRHKWRLPVPVGDGDAKVGDGSRAGPPLRVLESTEQAQL